MTIAINSIWVGSSIFLGSCLCVYLRQDVILLLLQECLDNGFNEQKRKSLVSLLASYFLATTVFSMVYLTKIKYRIDCVVRIQAFPAWHACLMELETSWPSELCRIKCQLLQVITSGSFLKLSRFLSKVFVCRVNPDSHSFDYWRCHHSQPKFPSGQFWLFFFTALSCVLDHSISLKVHPYVF